ncbi:MAG: prolipoprotein diacylglyceryl transferase [Myxococcota bacterium]
MWTTLLDTHWLGFDVELDAYGTFLNAGAVLGVLLALWLAHRRGLPVRRSAAVLLLAAAAIPVGARALVVTTDPGRFAADASLIFRPRLVDFALYGGLMAAVVVGPLAARALRVDLWRLADAAAPGIALGIAMARFGCFCEGCCFGVASDGPLAVTFPLASPAHAAQLIEGTAGLLGPVTPVLPTQLFEAAGALACGVLVLGLLRVQKLPKGVAFLALAGGFTIVRLGVYPLRWVEPEFIAPSWTYPVMYVVLLAVCLALLATRLVPRRAAAVAGRR